MAKKSASLILGPVDVKPYKVKKGEEYMNDKQLKHFKTILELWKQQLRAEITKTVHNIQKEAANFPDWVDRASQEEDFRVELRTRDRERRLIRKIDDALESITASEYGYCEDCGAEIGVKRLEARPTATKCIECKTLAEFREKQVGEEF